MSDYSELREGVQALADKYKAGFPNLRLSRSAVVDALNALLNADGAEEHYEVWYRDEDTDGPAKRSLLAREGLTKEGALLRAERLNHSGFESLDMTPHGRRYFVRKVTTTRETLS